MTAFFPASQNTALCQYGIENTGRDELMPLTEEQTRLALDLKEAILNAYDPEAIILFGSLGRGDADEFSDVDLLLVMETDRDADEFSKEIGRYLDPLAKDKHIIMKTPWDFCRQRDIPGTIVFSAAREGQILFDKKDWERPHLPRDSYETRKQAVIHQEYILSAHDFLNKAQSSLHCGQLFRCRDFARFAAVRAIKGLFVKHDIHPPRETDLVKLLSKAEELEPDLMRYTGLMGELNNYCPDEADTLENRRSGRMVERTAGFVKEIMAMYAPHVEEG